MQSEEILQNILLKSLSYNSEYYIYELLDGLKIKEIDIFKFMKTKIITFLFHDSYSKEIFRIFPNSIK